MAQPDDAPHVPYKVGDALQQWRSPVHCIALADDGMFYVCDRQGDRVQVFTTDGKFQKEHFFARTRWRRAPLGDRLRRTGRRFTYPTDGQNERVRIVRETLTE
jgi:hypothetical protein